jgi:hypothetical protein
MMGPRSTDAVRKLTESSWPSLKKKNQTVAMTIMAANAIIVLGCNPISLVFRKQPPPCGHARSPILPFRSMIGGIARRVNSGKIKY